MLCCHALPSVRQEGALPVFERAFAQFGLPQAIRTDNGVPFATQAICGLSKLSVWWIKLGITHQRIEPGQPQHNGRHERMHKTLKRETARPPEQDHMAQQARFNTGRNEFNQERAHEALDMRTPASVYTASVYTASVYTASARPLPATLPPPCYPGHFQVRLVSKSSMFRLHHRAIFISEALIDEYTGLEEIGLEETGEETGDGVWSVYFYDVLLGRLSERDYKIRG